jgi:hypothetical protein
VASRIPNLSSARSLRERRPKSSGKEEEGNFVMSCHSSNTFCGPIQGRMKMKCYLACAPLPARPGSLLRSARGAAWAAGPHVQGRVRIIPAGILLDSGARN